MWRCYFIYFLQKTRSYSLSISNTPQKIRKSVCLLKAFCSMGEIFFCKYFVMDFTEGWFSLLNFPMAPIKGEILEAVQAALGQCLWGTSLYSLQALHMQSPYWPSMARERLIYPKAFVAQITLLCLFNFRFSPRSATKYASICLSKPVSIIL